MGNTFSLKRYLVKCSKCGYEWLARTENPERCALCNCKNINQPKQRQLHRS